MGAQSHSEAVEPRIPQRSAFGAFVRSVSLPNVLTCIRIVLIPLFVWLVLTSGDWQNHSEHINQHINNSNEYARRWWALGIFALLMFTDQLDGFLARRYEVITDFGKLADPIADKALMIAAFVSLNLLGELWWSVTIIIMIREFGITFWRMVLARRGRVVPASQGGKLKTVLQTVAVGMFLAPFMGLFHSFAIAVMAIAVVVTVVTGAQYLLDAKNSGHS